MLTMNDPFRDFDSLFGRLGRAGFTGNGPFMAIDAYRRGNDVWVHMDVPGVSRDDLDISVERGVLTITTQRNWTRQEGDRPYFAERQSGSFKRQIQLGEGLNLEAIEADLHNGVLTLRIPVAEKAQPKRITVGTKPAAIDVTAS
jgi:HSP20 family protein